MLVTAAFINNDKIFIRLYLANIDFTRVIISKIIIFLNQKNTSKLAKLHICESHNVILNY
jgi:hypothetical protein